MMKLATSIVDIIGDYHNCHGFQFTEQHILKWVSQFDEVDREFVLHEFLHLLSQGIYISRQKAKQLLRNRIEELSWEFGYRKPAMLLGETIFLSLQKPGKSQSQLLGLLDEVLHEGYSVGLRDCGTLNRKYFIYLDDVLATGNTTSVHLVKWLSECGDDNRPRFESVNDKTMRLIVSVFCCHNWGWGNTLWKLKIQLKNDQIMRSVMLRFDYEIQNQIKFNNPRLNLIYPAIPQPRMAISYLEGLEANAHVDRALRKKEVPMCETFFSSSTNRVRFENILLYKGISIVNKIKNPSVRGIRPLGYTSGNHRIFGLGTLFFTWRNVPNNSPLVFWWNNQAHNWSGLFPVFNRGGQ